MNYREPPDPQGNSNEATWMRGLIRWARQFRLLTVKGGRKIPDPSGGYHLVIEPESHTALREISICVDGDSTWFAQVAMTKPYKKDEDGKAYYPDPYPPGV